MNIRKTPKLFLCTYFSDHFEDVIEEHANMIVSKMEQDPTLFEDTPAAEELRR